MATDVFKLLFQVVTDDKGLTVALKSGEQQAGKTEKSVKSLNTQIKKTSKESKGISKGFSDAAKTAAKFGFAASAAFAAFSLKRSIDEAVKLQNSFIGLSTIARSTGADVSLITNEAKRLASQGLIPLSDVTGSLKNLLLATNGNVELSVKAFEKFRDVASFNRQGTLQLGEAIRRTTDGIKNQISTLTDNIGTTENLSSINKKYAESIGKSLSQLTDQEKKLGSVIGLMKEASKSTGDFEKLLGTFSGAVSAVTTDFVFLLAEIGNLVIQNEFVVKSVKALSNGLKALKESVKGVSIDFESAFIEIRNAIVTVGIAAFALLAKSAFKAIASIVTQYKVFRIATVTAMTGASTSFLGFAVSVGIASKAIQAFKIAISFGLLLVLDFVVAKVLEMRDEFGSFANVAKFLFLKVEQGAAKMKSAFVDIRLEIIKLQIGFDKALKSAVKFVTRGAIDPKLADFSKALLENANDKVKALQAEFNIQKQIDGLRSKGEASAPKVKPSAVLTPEIVKEAKSLGTLMFEAFFGGVNKSGASNLAKTVGAGAGAISQGARGGTAIASQVAGTAVEAFAPGFGQAAGQLTALLAQGPDAVKATVQAFTDSIPLIIENIVTSLPVLVEALIIGLADAVALIAERADIIVEKFIFALIRSVPRIIGALIRAIPRIATALISQMPSIAISFGKALIDEIPNIVKAFIDEISGSFTGGIAKSVGGGGSFVGDAVGAIGDVFGFAKGGRVKLQDGGTTRRARGGIIGRDSIPALVQDGEVTIDRTLTRSLDDFLAKEKSSNNESGLTDDILINILNALQNPQTANVSVELDGRALANAILKLNRNNARLA